MAGELGLDPEGEIAGLLARRDTWSGRAVQWPVAGTGLRVPVDLAALPVYDRQRTFEGFRGFGVARTGDAVPVVEEVREPEEQAEPPVSRGRDAMLPDEVFDEAFTQEPEDRQEEVAHQDDPFRGEVPALTIVPQPERRYSDKVIHLAEHRQPNHQQQRSLSASDRLTFDEIGRQLRRNTETEDDTEAEGREAPDERGATDVTSESESRAGGISGEESVATPPSVGESEAEGPQRLAETEAAEEDSRLVEATAAADPAGDETSTREEPAGEPVAPAEDEIVAFQAEPEVSEGETAPEDSLAGPAAGDEQAPSAPIAETASSTDEAPVETPSAEAFSPSPEEEAGETPEPEAEAEREPEASGADADERAAWDEKPADELADSRTADEAPATAAEAPSGAPERMTGEADAEREPGEDRAEGRQPESEAPPEEVTAAEEFAAAGETPETASETESEDEPEAEAPTTALALPGSEEAVSEEAVEDTAEEEAVAASEGEAEAESAPASEPEAAAEIAAETEGEAAAEEEAGPTRETEAEVETEQDPEPKDLPEESAATVQPLFPVRQEQPEEAGQRPEAEERAARAPATRRRSFVPSAFAGRLEQERRGVHASVLWRLPVPLIVHSGDVLYHANRAFLDLTGYASLYQLEQAGGLDAIFADPLAAEATSDRKLRLRRRDGTELPVDGFLQAIDWNGGRALLLALTRPPEKPAAAPVEPPPAPADEEAQRRIAELLTIIDTATDGVVIIGRDGTIRSISRPAEALFGFDSADAAGKPFAELFAIESQRAVHDYLAGLSENGVASVLNDGREVIGREAQGRFIPLFMTIGRLPGEGGFCAVLRDITQWKRAEEELTQARAHAERASSQKTEFLARVSHEIRTPLNAIIGFSELMIDEKFGPISNERYRDYLRDINRSGNHVLDLVNDLLDISKIEAGQQEMAYEAVSLNEALGEAVAMMQPQANRERVIIRSSMASRLPEVVADLRSIRQIALNLLSNAIRYTPAGGQVIVSTAYEASGDVVIRVRDTGVGMATAEIEQALKPFKQINALKRPRGDGTGLGLPLTKALVEANRARFAISSTPGEGTMVEITFPSTRVLAD